MKKLFLLVAMFIMSAFAFSADYHIGVVSGTVSQSEDGLRGAQELIKKFGAAEKGGKVIHITYPDNFMQEMETTISQIVSLADDPKMKAIVITEAVPGTVEAFRRVREKNPDIILVANSPHEDPEMIADVADLVLNPDNVARGYLIVKAAQEMGAKKFMHISFPRHMSYELLSRRRDIMKQAASDLGMEFITMTAPDPVSDVGVAGAQQFILEKVPSWLEKYGKDTAFFATNDAQTEPLLKRIAEDGGYFVEADLPSPTMGYPGALGVKFDKSEKGNWPKILNKVEKSVVKAGGSGRMGTWAYSYNFAAAVALGTHVIDVIDGRSEVDDFDQVMASLGMQSPGAGWNGSEYVDVEGIERENFFLVYQDTYVFGKGYLHMTALKVPEQYFEIN
ncbi:MULTISPECIES: DUF3798 domain-containing protein [Psychrilyobacter]|uniref:DUF3798 domain-containing protein n=1 Tax=Psychrilyobacter piezotolerans TaxID=2293438 RepID=A0ABX9KH15_9FUSO|nr:MULTISPECIES: DUF3798 domain-containing protein [Psychrilyobacter]MCS5421170.1 DUF3798 domain-containing protein [Psychrilyobacter sp. S5]NDI77915.1 DUF3798 domain-containing protein [Psychrilyobacter piezotolerans]RDE62032.1 DUF3798 domain-containing protein [Psychrilyobacter sp. S5]REI41279.1 DUF3798 domain-containing protein [Psychrilyobacter piezotolerans]